MNTSHLALLFVLLSVWSALGAKESNVMPVQTHQGLSAVSTSSGAQHAFAANGKQLSEIDVLSRKARRFARAYLPTLLNPSLKDFDAAFGHWRQDKRRLYTDEQVVEMLGAYLGTRMVADFSMEWVVLISAHGADVAVRAAKRDVLSLPFSLVAQRVKRGEQGFMVGIYQAVQDDIARSGVKGKPD